MLSKSPNRALALTFGVVYLLIGILGVAATDNATLFGRDGGLLFGVFEVNILHNAVHTLIGLGLILASSAIGPAKRLNVVVGATYLALGIVGLFILDSAANILALNGADNVLHLGSALVLLAVGLGADKRRAKAAV